MPDHVHILPVVHSDCFRVKATVLEDGDGGGSPSSLSSVICLCMDITSVVSLSQAVSRDPLTHLISRRQQGNGAFHSFLLFLCDFTCVCKMGNIYLNLVHRKTQLI